MPPLERPAETDRLQVHLDLEAHVHLADVEHHGLSIDLGTPARMKYSLGAWRTGWGKDGREDGTTYSEVTSNAARLFIPLSGGEACTVRVRLKSKGSANVQVFLNNESLASAALAPQGFAEYDFPVPAGVGHAGENQLMLRFAELERANDAAPFVWIDWVKVVPDGDGSPAAREPVHYDALVTELAVGGYKRRAITLPAESSLTYYVELPPAAKLAFRAAAVDGGICASVRITPEGGRPVELWRGDLIDAWQVQQLPLDAFAGQVVKLELKAEGRGVGGFATPQILAPDPVVPPPPSDNPPRSVVLLLVDTLRADHLHAYNPQTRVQTPELDAFATQSAVFEAAQSPENWTKPAVASVLTGLYPSSHGTKGSDAQLVDEALLVSEAFKSAGFATATFIANGYVSDKFGFNQGWDSYTNYIREKRSSNAEHVLRDAASWIEAHKQERFFVYIQTIDPHVPYDPPEEFLSLYQSEPYSGPIRPRQTADQLERAKQVPTKLRLVDTDRQYIEALYDGEISFHDRAFGAFVERLKRSGVYDKTLVIVTADHGEEFLDHKSWGHGHTVYQELLAVPFIARYPPSIKPQRVRPTVSTVDIAPTALALAGVPVPDVMEGVDRTRLMRGGAAPPLTAAFSDFLDDRRVVRAGRWKLIMRGLTPTLFDLDTDPHEQVELELKAHPIALRYCRVLLGTFLGARDRGDWLNPTPAQQSIALRGGPADLDEATRGGLRALGYAN
ncbi:MAG: sulfatase [Polyangiales bacterium]